MTYLISLDGGCADAVYPRVDLICRDIVDGYDRVRCVYGTPTAGAAMDNLYGAPCLPMGAEHIAHVLVPPGSGTHCYLLESVLRLAEDQKPDGLEGWPALRQHLAEEFEGVREKWMRDIGDVHDAWNEDDLVDVALATVGRFMAEATVRGIVRALGISLDTEEIEGRWRDAHEWIDMADLAGRARVAENQIRREEAEEAALLEES